MKMKRKTLVLILTSCMLTLMSCRQNSEKYYSASDFAKVPKIDVHIHYNSTDPVYLLFADSLNFRLVTPNVDAGRSLDEQFITSSLLKTQYPEKLAFFGTFSVDSFGKPGFAEGIIHQIDRSMKSGASGIKIWKNIGMVLKDSTGKYVMVDDQAFAPVFKYLEDQDITLMAHLGEPRDCWLPVEEMALDNNRQYFTLHPEYHMYLHPDAPTYEAQINARDQLLRMYPKLKVIGAHLASLEWSIDELAKRLDEFPNLNADLSARIGHLQYQSLTNPKGVRDFLVKYQDRILYGTDVGISPSDTNYKGITAGLRKRWMEQWLYLATDSSVAVKNLGSKEVKGLKLPREVIDKIYFKNAEVLFAQD